MMQQNKRMLISYAENNAIAQNSPGGEHRSSSSSATNGTILTTPPRSMSKTLTKQRKHSGLSVEDDNTGAPQRILRHIKVCVICGNSNQVIDLSANPIMKETMSSYCETDDLDLDDCLSSVCITCVFKSNAVKDVQNKFKIRLKDLSNGRTLKTNPSNSETEYSYGQELAKSQAMSEKSYRKEEIIELNADMKHRTDNIQINGVYGINNSVGRMRGIECGNSGSPRFSPVSFVNASNLPIHKTTNTIKSVEYVEHKSIIQVDYKNYRLTDISSDCPTIQHAESINTEYNDSIRTTVLSPLRTDFMSILKNHPSSMASSCSNSTLSQNGLNHSMLQVVRERPESVLITESGGKINNYKSSQSPQTQRLCQYCGISYVRKDYYNKHVRRCRSISARSSSQLPASNAKNKKQFNAKRVRTNGIDKNLIIQSTPVKEPVKQSSRRFHCSECPSTLDNIKQLRQHRITHLRKYKCNHCKKEFTTLYEHDFHRTICLAEKQARLEGQEESSFNYDKKSVAKSERSVVSRRVTRAQSRAQTQVYASSKTKAKKILATTISKRRMTVLTSVSKFISANYDDENSDSDDCSNDDDDVSVADSMDSRRRVYTGVWLANSQYSKDDADTPTMHIGCRKEHDLILLESLKAQVKAQEFSCLVEDCEFFTDTLLNLILHDYVHHFKESWFYCQKCGNVFTSKVFLDYHLDRQNVGRYICYKCNEQFMFQHQLDSHLILHTKHKNHACTKCRCEFLTEDKLDQHRKIEHNNESEKKLIRIQSKETFASTACTANDGNDYRNKKQSTKYTVKILNMQLPRMPSKRPLELPGHTLYRRRIGAIEFENERNPNCCSCK